MPLISQICEKLIFSQSKTPGELQHWSLAKEQIGYKLKRYYQAYTTEDLPPQLLALIKKFDKEHPKD